MVGISDNETLEISEMRIFNENTCVAARVA
jgi:hypothetical protein